ncbi:unnamed protein product [Mytilus coruscus]|uniref:Ig-like domain-containing protein n=1 Tax=Mytilus coruscus TaxID=42192 RepID=A0A6J8BPI7_MYTCO|nr:unnamed protein product [Mytilus coruscus]
MNLTFKDSDPLMLFSKSGNIYHFSDSERFETNKYDIILRPNIIEFQIINITANDTGNYWIESDWDPESTLQLSITNMSCPSRATEQVCAIKGSSPLLKFKLEVSVYYNQIEERPLGRKHLILSNFTIHVDLHIYNVTPEDEGYYRCNVFDWIKLEVYIKKLKIGRTRKSLRKRQNKNEVPESTPDQARVQQHLSPDLEVQPNIINDSISGSHINAERQNTDINVDNIDFRLPDPNAHISVLEVMHVMSETMKNNYC